MAPCPAPVLWGKAVGMSPRQQPTSRKHTNGGNADSAVERQARLTISTGQISSANQQRKSNDFFTREQRWRAAFENSAIGINMADLEKGEEAYARMMSGKAQFRVVLTI